MRRNALQLLSAILHLEVVKRIRMHYNLAMNYNFRKDIDFILDITGNDLTSLAAKIGISRRTLLYSLEKGPSEAVLEKTYSYIYQSGYFLSSAKNEIFFESLNSKEQLFYHGSKSGIEYPDPHGSRKTSDLSNGFYCSGILTSAISFVEEYHSSSVYVFKADLSGLKICSFDCDLNWMLVISYYRNKLNSYRNNPLVTELIRSAEEADVITAPIADNKIFEILNLFSNGDITSEQALHSLSASRLGKQYVFKTQNAVDSLHFLDRFYLCDEERRRSKSASLERSGIIQTKLDMAKREFRGKGKYIDEILL